MLVDLMWNNKFFILGPPVAAFREPDFILAERFARGEIDEADYLSRRNALRS